MKKQFVDLCESKLADLTPNADYNEIYDDLEAKKVLFAELCTLLVKEVPIQVLAGAVVGSVVAQFKDDENKIREAIYALINIADIGSRLEIEDD